MIAEKKTSQEVIFFLIRKSSKLCESRRDGTFWCSDFFCSPALRESQCSDFCSAEPLRESQCSDFFCSPALRESQRSDFLLCRTIFCAQKNAEALQSESERHLSTAAASCPSIYYHLPTSFFYLQYCIHIYDHIYLLCRYLLTFPFDPSTTN